MTKSLSTFERNLIIKLIISDDVFLSTDTSYSVTGVCSAVTEQRPLWMLTEPTCLSVQPDEHAAA